MKVFEVTYATLCPLRRNLVYLIHMKTGKYVKT